MEQHDVTTSPVENRGVQVLQALIDHYPDDVPLPARITIEQGTELQWACRVYEPFGTGFSGQILTLDE